MDSWPVLAASAASVGFLHTALGPDHYLPFVAIGAARRWSRRRLVVVTAACGLAHVGASLAIALVIGGLLGLGTARVEETFGWQGSVVAWALVALGTAYTAWGIWRPHRHGHRPPERIADGAAGGGPRSAHRDVTIWALVLVFAFGPCEALIPLVMLPAAQGSPATLALVLGVFATATILTMLGLVLLLHAGVRLLPSERLARLGHPLAGVVVALCGVAILLGL